MNKSQSSSDKKLVIKMPKTPISRREHLVKSTTRKPPKSKSPRPAKSQTPLHKFKSISSYSFLEVSKLGASPQESKKPHTDISKTPTCQREFSIVFPIRKKPLINDNFMSSPTSVKTPKKRVLPRRPQHMSFLNLNKPDRNRYKSDYFRNKVVPSVSNYEYSGNMLINVMTHTYKPVKFRLKSQSDYRPAAWNRNL